VREKELFWTNLMFIEIPTPKALRDREQQEAARRLRKGVHLWAYTCPRSKPAGTRGFPAW
jgi:hypothetical protein